jgi:chaperonin GroES
MLVVEMIESTPTRIKLPDWQRTLRGKVIAVGPGKMLPFGGRAPMECRVGDIVTFPATAGMEADYGVGKKTRMMRDPDVDTAETP